MLVGPSDGDRTASRARPQGTAAVGRVRDCLAWGHCRNCRRSAGPAVDHKKLAESSGEAGTVPDMGSPHCRFDSDRALDLHRGVLQSSCSARHNPGRQLDQPCPSREPGGSWRTGPLRRPRRPSPRVRTTPTWPRNPKSCRSLHTHTHAHTTTRLDSLKAALLPPQFRGAPRMPASPLLCPPPPQERNPWQEREKPRVRAS